VLAAWSGLGYYRRARLLHQGARHVARSPSAAACPPPPDAAPDPRHRPLHRRRDRLDRPRPPAALVDGNVARVLSRLQAITDPKQQAADAAGHWTLAQQIVEAGSPRVLAQALMELGATVCTPQQPKLRRLPGAPECLAHARGLVDQIPAPKKRAPSPQQDLWAVGVRRAGKLLLTRRPAEGLLAGMWCLPLLERPPAAPEAPHGSLFDRARVTPGAMRKLTGAKVKRVEPLREPVKHVFTHRVWLLWPCRGEAETSDLSEETPLTSGSSADTAWIAPGERPAGGIPTVTEKLLERLGY
jgi:A/G-specific adenine glycosylase